MWNCRNFSGAVAMRGEVVITYLSITNAIRVQMLVPDVCLITFKLLVLI